MNWYHKIKIASLPIFKERDFIKKLRKLNCFLTRAPGTSHHTLECPGRGRFQIALHGGMGGGKDLNPIITKKIITENLGMTLDQFRRL